MAQPLVVRAARSGDLDALVEIQHSQPAPEIVGLAGTVPRARRLGRALMVLEGVLNPDRPIVVIDGERGPVAFLQYSIGPAESGGSRARLAVGAVAALGVGVLGLPRRLWARRAVELIAPEDSFYIAELHVHPNHRGKGLGGQLLDWSASECVSLGLPRRSLITGIGNPAIRLYERHGFAVVTTATDETYEQIFGRAGRLLMTAPA